MFSKRYKRYVTVLLLIVYIFNQLDRTIFAILMEPIKREFDLSDTQLGFLAGPALMLLYAILGVPVARWADRGHRINIMSLAVALWSGIVMSSAIVASFWQLALVRIGVGIGEAGFSAVAQSVIADYHSAAERTRALSIYFLALPLGPALSNLLGGWANEVYGWRTAFLLAGVPGIALALLLKTTVREPRCDAQRTIPSNPTSQLHGRPPLPSILLMIWHRRALRHLTIAMALMTLVTGGLLGGWLAPFFIRVHDMSTAELGYWLAFNAGVGGGLGVWLSGALARGFVAKGERTQVRVLAVTAALAWPILVVLLLCPTKVVALGLAFAAVVVLHFFFAPAFSLVQGLCAVDVRATVVAIVLFCQILVAGVVGVQLTGVLSDVFASNFGSNSVRWAMMSMTPMAIVASLHFWLAGRTIRDDLMEVSAIEKMDDQLAIRSGEVTDCAQANR